MIGSIKIFAAIVLVAFVGSIFAFVLTLYLQRIPGFSPLMTGLAFLPSGLGGVFGGQLANRAARCLGVRRAALLGLGLIIVGAIVLTRIEAAGGAVRVITGYLIASVGVVCTLVLMSTTAMASLQADLQGLAAGLLTTFQQVGAALGTSLASVVASTVARAIGGAPTLAATTGYQAALYLALALAVLASAFGLLHLQPSVPGMHRRHGHIMRKYC